MHVKTTDDGGDKVHEMNDQLGAADCGGHGHGLVQDTVYMQAAPSRKQLSTATRDPTHPMASKTYQCQSPCR